MGGLSHLAYGLGLPTLIYILVPNPGVSPLPRHRRCSQMAGSGPVLQVWGWEHHLVSLGPGSINGWTMPSK